MGFMNKIKYKLANRNNKSKLAYLRRCGAEIGEGTKLLCGTDAFGTEPYLISVGDNTLFSSNVSLLTHDGGVKVLNDLKLLGGGNGWTKWAEYALAAIASLEQAAGSCPG